MVFKSTENVTSIADFLYRSNRLLLFLKVDNAHLASYADIIRNERQIHTSYEREIIKRGQEFYRMCSTESASYKTLKSPNPAMEMKAVHMDGDSLMAGIGVAIIDADVATCLAYEFMKSSRTALAERKIRKIVEAAVHKLNDHSHMYFSVRDLGVRGFFNREFRVKAVWQMQDDGAAFLAYEDTQDLDDDFPRKAGNVVASIKTACRFEPLGTFYGIPRTKVTYVARSDLKGVIPAVFTNMLVGKYFHSLSKLHLKFERDDEIDKISRAAISKKIKVAKNNDDGDFSNQFTKMKKGKVRDTNIGGSTNTRVSKVDHVTLFMAHKKNVNYYRARAFSAI